MDKTPAQVRADLAHARGAVKALRAAHDVVLPSWGEAQEAIAELLIGAEAALRAAEDQAIDSGEAYIAFAVYDGDTFIGTIDGDDDDAAMEAAIELAVNSGVDYTENLRLEHTLELVEKKGARS